LPNQKRGKSLKKGGRDDFEEKRVVQKATIAHSDFERKKISAREGERKRVERFSTLQEERELIKWWKGRRNSVHRTERRKTRERRNAHRGR